MYWTNKNKKKSLTSVALFLKCTFLSGFFSPPAATGHITPVVLWHRHSFVFSKCQTFVFPPQGHKPNIPNQDSQSFFPISSRGPSSGHPSKNLHHQKAAGFYLHICECLHLSGRLFILFSSPQRLHFRHAAPQPFSLIYFLSLP